MKLTTRCEPVFRYMFGLFFAKVKFLLFLEKSAINASSLGRYGAERGMRENLSHSVKERGQHIETIIFRADY